MRKVEIIVRRFFWFIWFFLRFNGLGWDSKNSIWRFIDGRVSWGFSGIRFFIDFDNVSFMIRIRFVGDSSWSNWLGVSFISINLDILSVDGDKDWILIPIISI